MPAFSQRFRRHFWVLPGAMVAVAAYCNAQAVSQLIGVSLAADAAALAQPPRVTLRPPLLAPVSDPARGATTILHRNVFDHVTGALDAPSSAEDGNAEGAEEPGPDTSDPWSAPSCEGVNVRAIVASDDEEWSIASIMASDGKRKLVRRGGDASGKTVYFIGWDRVWLTSGGALCQSMLFGAKVAPAASPVAAPARAPAVGANVPGRGAPALSADLKQGIQSISATEFNIDRGILDKILENQADLMRQARVVPVQENGRVVGVRLNGVKPDALLGVLGMQNGDVLRTINGFEMGNPQKALEAYARLRTANHLTIEVTRATKNVNLDYNIK